MNEVESFDEGVTTTFEVVIELIDEQPKISAKKLRQQIDSLLNMYREAIREQGNNLG